MTISDIQRVRLLRWVGISEGISFLVLLLIAMPVKYIFHLPGLVELVGWIHGVLFMAYGIVVLLAAKALRYKMQGVGIAWAAAFLPIGTFLLDLGWRKREQELRQAQASIKGSSKNASFGHLNLSPAPKEKVAGRYS